MLYIVGTPIGNREDITLRALRVLKECDAVLAEDTRHSGQLLRFHEIKTPLLSYHRHNEARRTAEVLPRLKAGETLALITDAGMPSLSDPGQRLIAACRAEDIAVEVVPGPSAITAAAAGSGWESSAFYFGGFLPPKSGRRQRVLQEALERPVISIHFESPHRLLKTLACLADLDPAARIMVAREITKKFETFHENTAAELMREFETRPVKGELTLLIKPSALVRG